MPNLVMREIESLEKIRSFGEVSVSYSYAPLEDDFKMGHYPPQAFAYSSRPPKKVKIGSRKAFVLASTEDIERGYISGVYRVVVPNFKVHTFGTLRNRLSSNIKGVYLCSISLSKYSYKLSTLDIYSYGKECTYNFKVPHEIKNLERFYDGY